METWRQGQPKWGRSEDEEGRLSEDEETGVLRMVRDRGFEPLTPSVSRRCSTTELTALQAGDENAVEPSRVQALNLANSGLPRRGGLPLNPA